MLKLKEHNDIMRQQAFRDKSVDGAGVLCPNCFEPQELVLTHPGTILCSMPAQMNVHCPVCGYHGYKVV